MMNDQPTGIIRCLPIAFLREAGGDEYLERVINLMNAGRWTYYVSLPGKPRIDVLHFYLCIAGRVRYRANIIGYDSAGTRKVASGKNFSAKCWVNLGPPVVAPPHEWPLRGFQGFRYTEELW